MELFFSIIFIIILLVILKYRKEKKQRIQEFVAAIEKKYIELSDFVIEHYELKPCTKCNEMEIILEGVSPNGRSITSLCHHCNKKAHLKIRTGHKGQAAREQWDNIQSIVRELTKIAPVGKPIIPRLVVQNDFSDEEVQEKTRELIPEKVKNSVWRRDQGKCVLCESNENLEFDHIIPFSKGGANTTRNLQLLCQICNRKKSNKI